MAFNILSLISTIIIITLIKRLVNISPLLASCLVRWKENINLESSVKNSYDRSLIAAGLIIPFCLLTSKFRLYEPSFMEGMGEDLRIGVISGIFAAYLLIRALLKLMLKTKKSKKKIYYTAAKASYTYFIVLTLVLFALGGTLSFLDIPAETIKSAMLWISASIYVLLLLRKLQIFNSAFSIFASFLYLCALEIIPTGLLIASALIF